MRRLLLLLPVLLVIAALVALRGCTDEHDPRPDPAEIGTLSSPEEALEPARAEPRNDARRRVRTVAPPAPETSDDEPTSEDALPRLRGRVETSDGRPLRGRPVQALMNIAISQVPATTHTDEEGRFELPANAFVPYSIEVRVPLDAVHDAVLEHRDAGVDDEIVFVAQDLRSIDVTLVTIGGAAVPNTLVDVTTPEMLLENGVRILAATQRKRTGHRLDPDTVPGHFGLRVPAGLRPTFTLPDHHTLTLAVAPEPAAGASEIVLVASEGAAIEGLCVDQHGEPVAGALVFAASRGDAPTHRRIGGTNEDGRFRVTGLTPGTGYRVGARQHGYMDGELQRDRIAGTTDVRLELVKGRTVNGVLRRADGALAHSGVLVLTGAFRGTWLQYEIPVNAGRFVWRGVVGDALDAAFRPDDGDEVSLGRLPAPGPDGLIELVLPD